MDSVQAGVGRKMTLKPPPVYSSLRSRKLPVESMVVLPAGLILFREFAVSALRETMAGRIELPVTLAAKWKTTLQMFAIGFLLAGPAGDKILPYTTEIGITLLWVAAVITMYTGYDYFRAGAKHMVD